MMEYEIPILYYYSRKPYVDNTQWKLSSDTKYSFMEK